MAAAAWKAWVAWADIDPLKIRETEKSERGREKSWPRFLFIYIRIFRALFFLHLLECLEEILQPFMRGKGVARLCGVIGGGL
jgi:hypothetical protein